MATFEKLSSNKVKLSFVVAPEKFDEALQTAYHKMVKKISILPAEIHEPGYHGELVETDPEEGEETDGEETADGEGTADGEESEQTGAEADGGETASSEEGASQPEENS